MSRGEWGRRPRNHRHQEPAQPRLHRHFTTDGQLNDTRTLQIGAVNASTFALVADGRNGLRVVQLISPENQPNYQGISLEPAPKLIAIRPAPPLRPTSPPRPRSEILRARYLADHNT